MGAATNALSDKCCDLAELENKLVETRTRYRETLASGP